MNYHERRKKEIEEEQAWEQKYYREYAASEQLDGFGSALGVIAIVLLIIGVSPAFHFLFSAPAVTIWDRLHGLWFLLPGAIFATVSLSISMRYIEGSEGTQL